MPRLEGVKVLDMKDGEVTKIEYEGDVYTKIDGGQSDIFRKSEQTERKPRPGDKIRIVKAWLADGKYENGDVLTVVRVDSDGDVWATEELGGKLIVKFEYEVIIEENTPQFKVGDFAKVIGETYWGNIKKGTIVKIADEADDEGDIRIELIDESVRDWAKAESLEKVNPTGRELSFLRAGRNIDEFKKGDVVEVLEDYARYSVNRVGDIGIITKDVKDHFPYKVTVSNRVNERNWHKANSLKLIAPVENRTDIERSESDE